MKTSLFSICCALATSGLAGLASASTNSTLDALVATASDNIQQILQDRAAAAASSSPNSNAASSSSCTSENVQVRREWAALTSAEKTSYIAAVQCLMSNNASVTPRAAAPGVRNRFDDFGALHVNKTATIHWTAVFLAWHRHYTWLYERALRDECGYAGSQPYWDWSSTATLAAHPLFDGSATSISGNGAPVAAAGRALPLYVLLPTPNVTNVSIAAGSGGGCLTSGPFANLTVRLGPHGAPVATDDEGGLGYHPRCLTRDFRDPYLAAYLSYDNVTAVMAAADLPAFSARVGAGDGLHSSGHTVTGGFQDDLWASAQDPSFVFHHAQVDRVWALWQGLDQAARTRQVADTMTIKNQPPSANGTLDTVVDMGYLADAMTIGELSSTIDGPFCYIYE